MAVPQDAPFTIVELDQTSEAWRQWRRGGIGASDAPTIMGENRWKPARKLLQERKRPTPPADCITPAMARGIALEPLARAAYRKMTGADVQPLCLQSREHSWMRCSLDGICLDTMQAVEIKCGEAVYKRTARNRSVPEYYYGQIQHTLAVTGLAAMDFFCFLPDRTPITVNVDRDPAYIRRLIETEAAFWQAVSA